MSQDLTLPLWTGAIPNAKKSNETEKVEKSGIAWVTQVQEPNIAVYLPTKQSATGRAVVICPGGGYAGLAYDWEGTDIAKWLNAKGIAGIVLKYRLPSDKTSEVRYKTPLMDAERALRLTRQHAKEWNLDPTKVGIMGFSAGGHLASTVGTHFDQNASPVKDAAGQLKSRPDFMILIYPVITMKKTLTHGGSRDNLLGPNPDEALVETYSNEMQVKDNTPPTFLLHSADDGAVPVENSLMMYQALKDKKVPVEMHLFPTGGHGFSLAIGKGHLQTWPEVLYAWLQSLDGE